MTEEFIKVNEIFGHASMLTCNDGWTCHDFYNGYGKPSKPSICSPPAVQIYYGDRPISYETANAMFGRKKAYDMEFKDPRKDVLFQSVCALITSIVKKTQ